MTAFREGQDQDQVIQKRDLEDQDRNHVWQHLPQQFLHDLSIESFYISRQSLVDWS